MTQAAFPSPGILQRDGFIQGTYDGMELRDYFAAHLAPEIYFAVTYKKPSTEITAMEVAQKAYQLADALIKARSL